jgi:uncharacterized protein YgbK (DUF1537 family)
MLYTYYGDDFTGSTDVLETLALAGIPAALFLAVPKPEDLLAFTDIQALGIAGDSRSRTPEWMSANLPAIFATLKSFGAPVTHYKTCSTFDSALHIGNIGRAIELGIATFTTHDPLPTTHCPFVPIVVGAPHLGRYVCFGNLFATANDIVYRIDRHPTMSRHPVTPMREADLRRHLAHQTELPIALLDHRNLTETGLATALADHPAAILFDTLDEPSLAATGALLWSHAQPSRLFAAGSSGLTQSLIPAWHSEGLIAPTAPSAAAIPVDQVLVLSGSCSPATQTQIEWALANGFHGIPLDPAALIANPLASLGATLSQIHAGRSPILYTALGPLSPTTPPLASDLGAALGTLLHAILTKSNIRRTLLCGGDTSSHALQQLPVRALTFAAPLAPGAPLCRAHAAGTPFHDAEFILKGGQIGPPNFFAEALG